MARQMIEDYGDGYAVDQRRRKLLAEMDQGPAPSAPAPMPGAVPPPAPGRSPLPPSAVRVPVPVPPPSSPPQLPPPPPQAPVEDLTRQPGSNGPLPGPTPRVTYPEAQPSGITPVKISPPAPGVIPGWDATKWADPSHDTTKYQVGRILAKYPPTTQGLAQAWAEIQAQFPGASFNGKDTISGLPGTQGPVDVLHDASTGGSGWGWRDQVAKDALGGGAQTIAGPAAGGMNLGGVNYDPRSGYQFGYTGGAGGLPPEIAQFYSAQTQAIQRQQAEQAQVQAAMREALLKMMAQGQEPVDVATDKTLGPAASTYRNAARREQKQGREALAERAAFMGLNSGGQGSGAFESALQGQEQDTQNAIAGYEANLAMSELQNRRTLLTQALQIANALGARTEASDLQRELAGLDAQLRKQSLGFNYAQLGQQQGQYEDSMGYNYANLMQQMNRDALLAGLG